MCTLSTLLEKAKNLSARNNHAEAEPLFREVLEGLSDCHPSVGPDHHLTIAAFFGIAQEWVYLASQNMDTALASVARKVLCAVHLRRQRLLGPGHIETIHALHKSAHAMELQG